VKSEGADPRALAWFAPSSYQPPPGKTEIVGGLITHVVVKMPPPQLRHVQLVQLHVFDASGGNVTLSPAVTPVFTARFFKVSFETLSFFFCMCSPVKGKTPLLRGSTIDARSEWQFPPRVANLQNGPQPNNVPKWGGPKTGAQFKIELQQP
jgi:hypothetical protein